ncbi:hypothetical protein VCHA53O466_50118 [Vibrio chagasii]|nr:hypothetical protein VCHA53O466_50118 [Vibrio chagasii]
MTPFNSIQQYNEISKLVAKTYKSNLGKTRHKLSIEAGYKNDNAHVAAIKATEQETTLVRPTKVLIESLGSHDLDAFEEFTWFSQLPSINHQSPVNFTAPIYLKLFFDGFSTECKENLLERIYVSDKGEDDGLAFFLAGENEFFEHPDNYEFDYGVYFVATILQRIDPHNIIEDKELLLAHPDLALELLNVGSLYQYNFFARNPELVKKLGLESEVAVKYFNYLFLFSTVESFISYDFEIVPLANDSVYGDFYGAYKELELPQLEWVTKDVWQTVQDNESEGDFYTAILVGFLGALEDEYYEWCLPCFVQSSTNEKSWTDIQRTHVKHLQFLVEVAANDVITSGGIQSWDDTSARYALNCLLMDTPISLSTPPIKRLLDLKLNDYDSLHEFALTFDMITDYMAFKFEHEADELNVLQSLTVSDSDKHLVEENRSLMSKGLRNLTLLDVLSLRLTVLLIESHVFIDSDSSRIAANTARVQSLFGRFDKEQLSKPNNLDRILSDDVNLCDSKTISDLLAQGVKVSQHLSQLR